MFASNLSNFCGHKMKIWPHTQLEYIFPFKWRYSSVNYANGWIIFVIKCLLFWPKWLRRHVIVMKVCMCLINGNQNKTLYTFSGSLLISHECFFVITKSTNVFTQKKARSMYLTFVGFFLLQYFDIGTLCEDVRCIEY